MSVQESAELIEQALNTVEGARVYRDPSARVDPPGLVMGPPLLQWDAFSHEPTRATWTVYAVASMSDRALERLWEFVPRVAAAADEVVDAVVTRASPGLFTAGTTSLPCYDIEIEVAL